MATRLRLVTLLAALLMAAFVGVGSFLATGGADKADAHLVAGEFSLETTAPAAVPVGSNVTVGVRIDHAESPYQAVQWKIEYNELVVSFVSAVAGAPNCAAQSDNGSDLLLGCIDIFGPTLTFSGQAWTATFSCDVAGIAPWTLGETVGATAKTFVKNGTTSRAIHVHSGVTACINTADVSTTKTATPLVNAGQAVNNTVVGTNNGPQNWTAVVIADDMPDVGVDYNLGVIGVDDNGDTNVDEPGDGIPQGTVTADTNGDTVVDVGPIPCIPGYLPAFAMDTDGDTVPDLFLNNVMGCVVDLVVPGISIAPGGSVTLNTSYATSADSCNRTLVDVGMSVSTDIGLAPGPPVEVVDPDFLDGIDFPPAGDDNFALGITQVADCQVSLVKSGPAAGAVGDASSYTIAVNNAGPSNATNLTLTDNVPANLTVTSVVPSGAGNCAATVGNAVSCTWASVSPAGESVTINFTMDTPGLVCNEASATYTRFPTGSATSNETCFTMIPPYNGLVKGVDTDGDTVIDLTPAQGEDTILVNLWLCVDGLTDGVDNDGDSTVDEADEASCNEPGEGELNIGESIYTSADCDTRNDDDDGDGLPVDGSVADGTTSPYVGSNPRPECPQPTLADYNNGLVDKDGGELPEGLGAFEFQLKFDHKIFDIEITSATAWANGRAVNCSMTIITENDIRFGCVTTGAPFYNPVNNEADPNNFGGCNDGLDNDGDSLIDINDPQCWDLLGFGQVSGVLGATIVVKPEADLIFRIRPTKDNGVSRRLLDENCEVADIYGDIFPDTNAGLTQDCTDVDITIRRLEGDVNTDCEVDVEDAQLIAFRYGSFFGHLVYNQNYDLEPWPTADFDIDIKDLQFVFGRDGSTCQDPIPGNQWPEAASGVGQP